ncbi:hypothetical protein ACGC1H_006997 [Rhizoctonia solani]
MSLTIRNEAHATRLTSRFAREDIAFLDAGLGTTLEDVLHKNISHPLWSAHLIDTDPDAIVGAHLEFLKAGSSIILTATYQCAPETFTRAGYTNDQAMTITHKAIALAARAREEYMNTAPSGTPTPRIALSLGPFGATLSPAAEFSGIYPPPYGPSQPVTFFAGKQAPEDELKAEDALFEFHLNRISMLASSMETWDTIDIIGFETVPLLREARAIRRALSALAANPYIRIPPWWISFNFPDGVLPEQISKGINYTAGDALKTCFERYETVPASVPDAFGINCTQVKHLHKCLSLASEALRNLGHELYPKDHRVSIVDPQRGSSKLGPALVLYPNGGRVYDPSTMTWFPVAPTSSRTEGLSDSDAWAVDLAEVVCDAVPAGSGWNGLLIGGCCKTEPVHISALRKLL